MSTETEHAGDLTPEQAMHTLSSGQGAVLVDVRTTAEWETVGVVDLEQIAATPLLLEWQTYPTMALNPNFIESLHAELKRRGAAKDNPVLFLCRSGVRSAAAARAATAAGYRSSFNVAGGFEGSAAQGRPGWRGSGLPWKQP